MCVDVTCLASGLRVSRRDPPLPPLEKDRMKRGKKNETALPRSRSSSEYVPGCRVAVDGPPDSSKSSREPLGGAPGGPGGPGGPGAPGVVSLTSEAPGLGPRVARGRSVSRSCRRPAGVGGFIIIYGDDDDDDDDDDVFTPPPPPPIPGQTDSGRGGALGGVKRGRGE